VNLPDSFIQSLPLEAQERIDFLGSLEGPSPVSIRVNPFKAKASEGLRQVPWCKQAHYLSARPNFTADPSFHAGAYYPQEASSIFVDFAIRKMGLHTAPISALDLCGAPGGKTTLMRSALHDESFVWANEVVPKRAKVLAENIQKWGHEGMMVSNAVPQAFSEMHGAFDLILVDAPCSGEGLFRKQPDAVSEWSPRAVENCALRQKEILECVWPSLKQGGILIYSTCTFNRVENEENLKWLRDRCDVEFPDLEVPFEQIRCSEESGVRGYRFWPHLIEGEGFFISVIRKRGKTKKSKSHKGKMPFRSVDLSRSFSATTIVDEKGRVFLSPERGLTLMSKFRFPQKVFVKGFPIGTLKGKSFKPGHGLSMWRGFNANADLAVSYEEAMKYLTCQDIVKDTDEIGLKSITYESFVLGFGKLESKRIVSKYPKEFRIRRMPEKAYVKITESLQN